MCTLQIRPALSTFALAVRLGTVGTVNRKEFSRQTALNAQLGRASFSSEFCFGGWCHAQNLSAASNFCND
jgi:hypothetical protein